MKKGNYFLLFLLLGSTTLVYAQRKRPVRENVESMKIGFLTDRLQLTPEEAKAFWPVYNQYSDELDKLRLSRRENLQKAREDVDQMSDADAEKQVDNELLFRQNELDIMKKYLPQFKKTLSAKKVAKLYRAEEDFKRKLLEMIQDRQDRMDDRKPGSGKGPGPGR